MSLRSLFLAAVCVVSSVGSVSAGLWINEFHYDNIRTDVGEFVEIAVSPSMTAGLDLSMVKIDLINGSTGNTYDDATLAGKSPSTVNGYDFYSLEKADFSSPIQNSIGGADGILLSFPGGTQFLSYEGVISPPAVGPAIGLTSTDVGVSESNGSTPVGSSLGLIGTGSEYADFTWAVISDDTPGMLNVGQTVTAVPEPSQYLMFSLVGIVSVALSRTARRRFVLKVTELFWSKS
ncbi:hypothetical protein ACFL2H_00970 [Planctomycetota bacterium]